MKKQKIVKDFGGIVKVNDDGIRTAEDAEASELDAPLSQVLITHRCIKKRAEKIAENVRKDYKNEIYAVIVLKGAKTFANELFGNLEGMKIKTDYIRAKSYAGTNTTGNVKLLRDLEKNPAGKDILVIEDIIDTGITMDFIKKYLKKKKAKSVRICALFDKPSRRIRKIKIDYLGFKIPDKFVVGFGLDWNEKYRELPFLAVVKE